MVFATLALPPARHALAIRSETDSLFRLGLRSNLPLTIVVAATVLVQIALIFVPATAADVRDGPADPSQLALVLVASTVGFAAVEVEKWVRRRRSGPHEGSAVAQARGMGPGQRGVTVWRLRGSPG